MIFKKLIAFSIAVVTAIPGCATTINEEPTAKKTAPESYDRIVYKKDKDAWVYEVLDGPIEEKREWITQFVWSTKEGAESSKRWWECAYTVMPKMDAAGEPYGHSGPSKSDNEKYCGKEPVPTFLSDPKKDILNEICQYNSFSKDYMTEAYKSWFRYDDNSTIIKLAKKECARIYALPENIRRRESAHREEIQQEIQRKEHNSFGIARFYQLGSIAIRVVIKTDRNRRVKCIAYDNKEEPLAVDNGFISPPADEIQILIPTGVAAVQQVRCLEGK